MKGGPTLDNASISEIHDMSLISSGGGIPGLQSSQAMQTTDYFANFDRKVTPKYPMPITLDKSNDLVDLNFRTLPNPDQLHSTMQMNSAT